VRFPEWTAQFSAWKTIGKDHSETCDIACQNCAVYSVFPSGITSHIKIAHFNWECVGRLRRGGLSLLTSHWRCYLEFDVILHHCSLHVLQSRKNHASSNWYYFSFIRVTMQVTYTFVSICVHKTCRLVRKNLHSLCCMSCTCSSYDMCPLSLIMDSKVETAILPLQLHKTGSLTAVHFFKPRLCVLTPFIYDFLQFFWLLADGQPQVLSGAVKASRNVLASCDSSTILWLLYSFSRLVQKHRLIISYFLRVCKYIFVFLSISQTNLNINSSEMLQPTSIFKVFGTFLHNHTTSHPKRHCCA
jgi:hypothetical protein